MMTRPFAAREVTGSVHTLRSVLASKTVGRLRIAGLCLAAMLCTGPTVRAVTISSITVANTNTPGISDGLLEGNTNPGPGFIFRVTLSGPATGGESFSWTTADGTAKAGVDYATATGTGTFSAAETFINLSPVTIIGNTTPQVNRAFTITLSNLANGLTGTPPPGTATIVDDDKRTVVVTPPPATFEGNAGTTPFVFEVSLNAPALGTEAITVATVDGTATSTAGANQDFVPLLAATPANTLTWAAGATAPKLVTVTVNGDTNPEPSETFALVCSNPVNVTPAADAQATILNDELAGGVVVTWKDGTVTVTSTNTTSPGDADELFVLTFDTVLKGTIQPEIPADPNAVPPEPGQDAVPATDTTIVQVYVNGAPVLIAGSAPPANVTNEDALNAVTADQVKIVIIHAGAGNDIVDATDYHIDIANEIKTEQYGEEGDDILLAGDFGDLLDGGLGNDHLLGGFEADSLLGGPGDDILEGERIYFYSGKITGGDDTITGGAGRNVVIGGPGNDDLYAGGTYDILDYSTSLDRVIVDMKGNPDPGEADDGMGGKDIIHLGFKVLRGSNFDDTLKGYRWTPITILGGFGGDIIWGSVTGGDILYGESGSDTIYGDPPDCNPGADPVQEHGGPDIIMGGAGGDLIYGGPGADEIYGDGDLVPQNLDEMTVQAPDTPALQRDRAVPDDQMIRLWAHPLSATYPEYSLYGVIITPTATQYTPPTGLAAEIPGDMEGILNITTCLVDVETVSGYMTSVGDSFALPASEITSGAGLAAPGALWGDDKILGGGGADWIAGGGGDDTIYGGSDRYSQDMGKASPDPQPPFSLLGGDNEDFGDLIYGDFVCNRAASLANPYSPGTWYDYYYYYGYTLTVLPLPNGMPPPNTPLAADMARTTYGSDSIRGGAGADVILGGGGSDLINGNTGMDVIYGDFYFGPDDDATYYLINTTSTSLFGLSLSSGNDVIRGNESTDYLFGGPGSDTLIGGDPFDGEVFNEVWSETGDVLQGNAGNDTLIGCDLYYLGFKADDAIDRGFGLYGIYAAYGEVGTDTGASDTIDYSMVPPRAMGGEGIVVDLGDNVEGSGTATNDGEGYTDYIYAIENVVGSRHADTIMGTRKADDAEYRWSGTTISGRILNTYVEDAFGRARFPFYFGHPAGSYTRSMLGRLQSSGYWETGWDNILLGEDGDDIIIGRDGDDALCGGNGNDKIWGDGHTANGLPPPDVAFPDDPARAGSDELWGDLGDDELYGEWGNDILHGGAGADYLDGGNGQNILAYTEEDEAGALAINLSGGQVDLTVWDTLFTKYQSMGWTFNPVGTVIPPGGFPATTVTIPDDTTPGANTTIAFPGGNKLPSTDYDPRDTASKRGLGTAYCNGYYDVIVNRDPDPTQVAPGAVINPDRFQTIIGSTGSDVIYGHGTAPTKIYGDGSLWGGAVGASDILVGGRGNDELYGEVGDDILEGGLGDDLLVGGDPPPTPPGPQLTSDRDWVSYYNASAGVVVNLSKTGPQDTLAEGKDRITEIQNVLGSQFNDVIIGDNRLNTLLGDAGDDVLTGRADDDIREGNRTYVVSDTLNGGAGSDIADYRVGDPAAIAASAAAVAFGACGSPYDPTDICGFMVNDGENGSDQLIDIENIREPDSSLLLTAPTTKTISPGQSVLLRFTATGGDGAYSAAFDPTTATQDRYAPDGTTILGTKEVAILAAPADPLAPESPFVVGVDVPAYQAVQTLTGNPGGAGIWAFTVYARPLATTSFRTTVTDMSTTAASSSGPAAKQISRLVQVVVTDELAVSIEQPEYTLTAGKSVQLRGVVSGGMPPYQITWTAEDGSQNTTLSTTSNLLPLASPTVTTRYTLTVQDSPPDSTGQVAEASTKVTVVADTSTGSTVPSGSSTPDGSNASGTNFDNASTANGDTTGSTDGSSDSQTPTEVTGTETSPISAAACGFGVTSWVMVGNMLVLVAMKRRRW